jgi:hypothetical protein
MLHVTYALSVLTFLGLLMKSIKWTWAEPSEMNVKIEHGSNFVVHDSQLSFDAQEA